MLCGIRVCFALSLAFLFGGGLCPVGLQAQIVINEVVASNSSAGADEDGDFEDWIELHNPTGAAVSLAGWGLSDRLQNPFKWVLPDVLIAPDGYLLVWASNKDRTDPAGELHTNFAISQSGEDIVLTQPGGTTADFLAAIAIPNDFSYGRVTDGGAEWSYFSDPTPGAANAGAVELLNAPTFSHPAGHYNSPFFLTLSTPDAGVTIRYTTDGSEPTESSPAYSGAMSVVDRTSQQEIFARIDTGEGFVHPNRRIQKATVIRARAFKDGAEASAAATATYFVGPQFEVRWKHPVISISVNRDDFFGRSRGIYVRGSNYFNPNWNQRGEEWERRVHLEFFEPGFVPVLSQEAGARIHGGASRDRAKKSLRLYARGEYGANSFDHQIFPDQPDTSYRRLILRNGGNDADRSILRDGFMQGLIGHMDLDTQAYRPSIVFINGEYWGIHNIRERYDEEYLVRTHGAAEGELDLLEGNGSPEEGDGLHYVSLRSYLSFYDPAEPVRFAEISRRMDVGNFLRYQVAQIYLNNTDWPGNNIMAWRSRTAFDPDAPAPLDGRLRWLTYDLDFGYNLYWDYNHRFRRENHDTLNFATMTGGQEWPNPDWSTLFLRRLLRNESFRHDFINRMADELNTGFHPRRAEALLAQYWDQMWPGYPADPEAPAYNPPFEERDRWPMIYGSALPDQWNAMRTFARDRPGHMRTHLRNFFNLDAEYRLTVQVWPEGTGNLRVNSAEIRQGTFGLEDPARPFPWTGTYFRDVPVTVEAKPAPGFRFLRWEGVAGEASTVTFVAEGDATITAVFEASDVIPFPGPHPLVQGSFTFGEWSPDEPEGSFPPHMVFLQSQQNDPRLEDAVDIPYFVGDDHAGSDSFGFPYNNTSRTRLNGLGERGISLINTGRGRDLGAVILALDTRGIEAATVGWEASTERANSRTYAVRLQYRVGTGEVPFQDLLTSDGDVVEYERSGEAGVSVSIGPVALPPALLGQAYVQLRWKFYFTGVRLSEDSGARDEIRIDEIAVRSTGPSYLSWIAARFPSPADQANPEVAGPAAAPLGDGVPNLARYALGLSWTEKPPNDLLALGVEAGEGSLTLQGGIWRPDVIYSVETSEDLVEWEPFWRSSEIPQLMNLREVMISLGSAQEDGKFYRLRFALKPE